MLKWDDKYKHDDNDNNKNYENEDNNDSLGRKFPCSEMVAKMILLAEGSLIVP